MDKTRVLPQGSRINFSYLRGQPSQTPERANALPRTYRTRNEIVPGEGDKTFSFPLPRQTLDTFLVSPPLNL